MGHVGGHRYTGILCASKVLWVYEGRLAERRANHPAGRLSERRAIPPAALAQRRGGREATSSSLIVAREDTRVDTCKVNYPKTASRTASLCTDCVTDCLTNCVTHC